MVDFNALLQSQAQQNLTNALDSAVQVGDIKAARAATQQLQELALATAKKPAFTNGDIRNSLKAKAPWFGTDPRKSAKAVEFGKNMEPESFPSADAFAEAVIKAVEDEFKPASPKAKDKDEDAEDEPGAAEDEEDEADEEDKPEKKAARKKTDAPAGEGGTARAGTRKTSGPWAKLADAPKEVAELVRKQADKFTRNASKEVREKFISTALASAYNAAQQKKGK